MISKTLAILAGGKSSRMNYNNKAFLFYNEKTFIENIINAGMSFNEIIIIANKKDMYNKFGLDVFSDIYLDNGPLSGIHSALKNSKNDKVLCLGCDMPLITQEALNIIGSISEEYDVLVPKINKRLQPLCSIYSKKLIPKIEYALKNNSNKLESLIMSTNYKIIEDKIYKVLNEKYFFNINTPEEYKKLEEF